MNNIVELLASEVAAHPQQLAFVQGKRQITYGDFWQRVLRRVALYRQRGVGKGDRVLVFVPMSIELYEILSALFHIGATAVFLDAWASRQRLELSLELASCKACIMIPKAWLLLLFSRAMRKVPLKMFPGTIGSTAVTTPPEADANTALVTFTTGSTGIPKAAKRTHRFLLEQQRILAKELSLPRGTVDLATLPIFALGNLASGLTTLIPSFDMRRPGDFDPLPVIAEAKRHHAASSCASPAFFQCLMKGLTTPDELDCIKRLATGGAAVTPTFAAKLLRAFPAAKSLALYGSTEAEPIASVPLEELANHCDVTHGLLAGMVIPEISIAILPMDRPIRHQYSPEEWSELQCPTGTVGEICVAGPHVLKEYFSNPQAFQENKIIVGEEIYHRTGDAGRLDEARKLYLYGRASTAFQDAAGAWVYPMLREVQLAEIPGIRAGTILRTSQGITVFLETALTHGQALKLLADNQIPCQKLVLLEKIPRDPRHHSKIDYGALLEGMDS